MRKLLILCALPFLIAMGCTKDKKVNVFTVSDDKKLGEQLDSEIRANPSEYPILDKTKYPEAYQYVEAMRDDILSSALIFHKADFDWKVTIINKNILNAFAAPGGKIYVYTGLLKYVKSSSELAGIIAHEVTHADRRHSTQQMTKVYGVQILFSVLLGKSSSTLKEMAKSMATGAASLAWSREDEYEADSLAVEFLYSIKARKNYQCNALEEFFKRMQASGSTNSTPEWLQTHPLDEKRISRIDGHYASLGSPAGDLFTSEYTTFLTKIP